MEDIMESSCVALLVLKALFFYTLMTSFQVGIWSYSSLQCISLITFLLFYILNSKCQISKIYCALLFTTLTVIIQKYLGPFTQAGLPVSFFDPIGSSIILYGAADVNRRVCLYPPTSNPICQKQVDGDPFPSIDQIRWQSGLNRRSIYI